MSKTAWLMSAILLVTSGAGWWQLLHVSRATEAVSCADVVVGPGTVEQRQRVLDQRCPQSSTTEATWPSKAALRPVPADPSATATRTPSRPPSPAPTATPDPRLKYQLGQPGPEGAGTYLLWMKTHNKVYVVRDNRIIRIAPTTDLDTKTPNGDYKITSKQRVTVSQEEGTRWQLDYFMAFYRRQGASEAIGFHLVPHQGDRWYQPLNTVGQSGYVSHGCLRLKPEDAKFIWEIAPQGTRVLVR